MDTNDYLIEVDELAVSLTKPATKLGVPLLPFYLSMMSCFFGWMFYQSMTGSASIVSTMVFLILWLALYAFMLLITIKDIHGLMIYWVKFQYFRSLPNKAMWDYTDAYQP